MLFEKIFKKITEELIDNQLQAIYRFCNKNNMSSLVPEIYNNTTNVTSHVLLECVMQFYHEQRLAGELIGNTRNERVEFFENNFNSKTFFEKYPPLKELTTIRLSDYIEHTKSIILNYINDKTKIQRVFEKDFGEIKRIHCSQGDLHNGKSVSIVEFERGKLVYKPHSLKTDLFLKEIMSFFSQKINVDIITPKVYSTEQYGWQEFIEYKECNKRNEIENFYFRIGMYLAAFYLLSSTDMHHENLISFGEHPIFFDTESISTGSNSDETLGYKLLSDSVIQTAVLPEFNKDVYDVNFSAIFTGIISPEKVETLILDIDEKNDFSYQKSYKVMDPAKKNIPKINGFEADAKDVVDLVADGFSLSLFAVLSHKKEFISIVSNPFYNSQKLRQIIRPTKVYFNFLQSLINPNVACSFTKQEELYALLIDNFSADSKNGYLRVEKEIEDLKRGNIPEFYTLYGDNGLYSDGKLICPQYYNNSPKNTVLSKITCLSPKTIEYQKRIIYMSIQSIYGFGDLNKNALSTIKVCKERSCFAEKTIMDYSNYLFDNIIPCGENMFSFITPYPDERFLKVKYAEPGLYHMGGMVWYLAMYAVCFDAEKSQIAKGLLDLFLFQYFHKYKDNPNWEPNYSVYDGDGGLLYLCYNFSKAFNEIKYFNSYLEIRDNIIDRYLKKIELKAIDFDFIEGLSGIIYLISKIEYDISDNKYRNIEFESLIEKYVNELNSFDFSTMPLGIAHGSTGILMALLAIYQFSNKKQVLDTIKKILICEQNIIKTSSELNYSWCKGKGGLILSRVILKSFNLPDPLIKELVDSEIDIFNRSDKQGYFDNLNSSLCHGIVGSIEIFDILRKHELEYDDIDYYLDVGDYKLKDAKWFTSTKCKLDSFMLGSSGVAYSLLRQCKKNIPSLLTLDCYNSKVV